MARVLWLRYRPEHDVKLLAWPIFCVFSRLYAVMESKFAKEQGLCTTLSYDAFTDIESMIGDAVRLQCTPRSTPAACSLTRTRSHPLPLHEAALLAVNI